MSVIKEEIEKFTSIASHWWETNGPFQMLHEINPVRLKYITNAIRNQYGFTGNSGFKALSILDVGCGGGIASIPLSRLGARVVGIDAGEENIAASTKEAGRSGLDAEFKHTTIESFKPKELFDVAICLEVLEHVENPSKFITDIARVVKPGGIVIISTINRTLKSKLLAIYLAEYALKLLEPGTHDWNKFLTPAEVILSGSEAGLEVRDLSGITFNLFKREWEISKDIDVNYILALQL